MVWRYGFSYGPEPTDGEKTFEGVEFVEIGPGCFRMGSREGAESGDLLGQWCSRFGLPWGDQPELSDEMPVHWVEFQRGFFIAETEVTNQEYEVFNLEYRRSPLSQGDRCPVVEISWVDAREYCGWLSEQSGFIIRLPSESEWECACRAGSDGEFCFGDDEDLLPGYAWFKANSDGRAHEVGTRRGNAWGLHDFHGNVWEWCEDILRNDFENAPADGTAWTQGEIAPVRVGRGGSWTSSAEFSRSAFRTWLPPAHRWDLGVRPAFLRSDD